MAKLKSYLDIVKNKVILNIEVCLCIYWQIACGIEDEQMHNLIL